MTTPNAPDAPATPTRLAMIRPRIMFALAFVHLLLVAGVVHRATSKEVAPVELDVMYAGLALLWPVFVAATCADAFLEHVRPPAGDAQSFASAGLVGLVLNLLAVLLLSRPVGRVMRLVRPELPCVVARDYAGTSAVLAVSVGLLMAGLMHHGTVVANQNSMREATVRAQAWIGAHARAEFRRNVEFAALLHDVGKVAIPKEVIRKPGPLAPEEWTVIKTHTIEGQKMLDRVGGFMREVGAIVRASHERYGGGHAKGGRGEIVERELGHLREVRHGCLAAIRLPVRVRRERRSGLERLAIDHIRQVLGIERQPPLKSERHVRHDGRYRREHEQRHCVARPMLVFARLNAAQSI